MNIKPVLGFFIILIAAIVCSEIINFVYLTPFVLPYLLFMFSLAFVLRLEDKEGFHFGSFVFGFICDVLLFRHIFVLCVVFPLASYAIAKLVEYMQFRGFYIFVVLGGIYVAFLLNLGLPIAASLFASILSLVVAVFLDFVFLRLLEKRIHGEA